MRNLSNVIVKLKIMRRVVVGAFLGLLFMGCNQSESKGSKDLLSPEQTEAIKSEIKGHMEVVIEGLETNDPDKLFRDFWQSDGATFYLNGMAMTGYDKILDGFRQGMKSRQNTKITLNSEEIMVLGPGVAMHLAEFTNDMILENDSTVALKGYWSAVFRKIDGQWKVIHVHESFNPTP